LLLLLLEQGYHVPVALLSLLLSHVQPCCGSLLLLLAGEGGLPCHWR
jgi:hypothetical protein